MHRVGPRTWTRAALPLALVVAASWLGGCAQLQGGGTSQTEGKTFVRKARVSVATFQVNGDAQSGALPGRVRDGLLEAMQETGAFEVVKPSVADLLVSGTVVPLRSARATSPDELAIDLRVVERKSGRALAKTVLNASGGGTLDRSIQLASVRGADFVAVVAQDAGHLEVGEPATSSEDAGPVATTPLPPPDPVLEQLQVKLNALGYDCGPADGRMGPRTQNCLRSYQEEMGLDTTGELDEATAAQLNLD